MNVNIFFIPLKKKGGDEKEDGKSFLFEDYHGLIVNLFPPPLYTQQVNLHPQVFTYETHLHKFRDYRFGD
jgi:hypothetical protein